MAVLTRAVDRGGDRLLWVQRGLGVIYLVAGIAKPLPNAIAPGVPEDVGDVLRGAALANTGTPLEPISAGLATAVPLVVALVTVAMVGLGVAYLADGPLVEAAALGNVVMLACFALLLGRHDPWLPWVDGGLVVLAILVYARARRRSAPRTEPGNGS